METIGWEINQEIRRLQQEQVKQLAVEFPDLFPEEAAQILVDENGISNPSKS